MEDKTKGILSVTAGFIMQLVLGSIFIWGNITPYVTSYLRLHDESITMEHTAFMLPLQVFFNAVCMVPGYAIAQKLHPKITLAIGTCIACAGLLGASYMTNWWAFAALYGIFLCVATGLTYIMPIRIGWSYFPNQKGRVAGIITCGFGFSAAIFSILSSFLLNPYNDQPDIEVTDGKITNHYYSATLANGVPSMLRWICLCWAIFGTIATILIQPIKKTEAIQTTGWPTTTKECICEKTFWLVMVTGLLASCFGLYILGSYKIYGQQTIGDDEFLTIVSIVSNFVNGIGRFFWTQALDFMSFRKIILIIFSMQTVISVTYYWVAEIKWLFMIYICIVAASQGGLFSLYAGVSGKIYGPVQGGNITGLFLWSFGWAGIAAAIIQRFLIYDIGYYNMYWILFALTVVALLIAIFLYKEGDNKWAKERASNEMLKPLNKSEEKSD